MLDYIDSYEMSFKIRHLEFQDIMSTASGRFTPDFLSRLLNTDDTLALKEGSDISE